MFEFWWIRLARSTDSKVRQRAIGKLKSNSVLRAIALNAAEEDNTRNVALWRYLDVAQAGQQSTFIVEALQDATLATMSHDAIDGWVDRLLEHCCDRNITLPEETLLDLIGSPSRWTLPDRAYRSTGDVATIFELLKKVATKKSMKVLLDDIATYRSAPLSNIFDVIQPIDGVVDYINALLLDPARDVEAEALLEHPGEEHEHRVSLIELLHRFGTADSNRILVTFANSITSENWPLRRRTLKPLFKRDSEGSYVVDLSESTLLHLLTIGAPLQHITDQLLSVATRATFETYANHVAKHRFDIDKAGMESVFDVLEKSRPSNDALLTVLLQYRQLDRSNDFLAEVGVRLLACGSDDVIGDVIELHQSLTQKRYQEQMQGPFEYLSNALAVHQHPDIRHYLQRVFSSDEWFATTVEKYINHHMEDPQSVHALIALIRHEGASEYCAKTLHELLTRHESAYSDDLLKIFAHLFDLETTLSEYGGMTADKFSTEASRKFAQQILEQRGVTSYQVDSIELLIPFIWLYWNENYRASLQQMITDITTPQLLAALLTCREPVRHGWVFTRSHYMENDNTGDFVLAIMRNWYEKYPELFDQETTALVK